MRIRVMPVRSALREHVDRGTHVDIHVRRIEFHALGNPDFRQRPRRKTDELALFVGHKTEEALGFCGAVLVPSVHELLVDEEALFNL